MVYPSRYSYYFYNGYLCFLYIVVSLIFIHQISNFFSDETTEIWITEQQRQTARGFIWNRYFLAGLVLTVNFALPANDVIGLFGKKYFIILSIIIGLCHLLFVISICEHFACHHQYFRLSFPKDSKISNLQLFGLILFHILLVLAFLLIFRICPEYISNTQRYKHNTCLRVACHLINIMSIPLNYCALLAWNCEELNFRGIHPGTKRRWHGVMKKDKKGRWVVDVEPEDHRIFVV